MLLLLLAFLGGTLTIFSPCVLPVLPFVFARADRPFRSSSLPTLLGMALTFATVASAAAIGGAWVVRANQIGRVAALVVLAVLGLMLLLPSLGVWLTRPFVTLGARLQKRASQTGTGPGGSFLLGVAVGFLWAPCAGPVLGLILTGAALGGANARTTLLLLAFGMGAAVSLGLATVAGKRVFAAMKRGLGAEDWIRKGLGVAVLLGVLAAVFGWDTGILARLSLANTTALEHRLVDRLAGGPRVSASPPADSLKTADADQLPDLSGATGWLNSSPLTPTNLRGHVVLLDVWTYSCINCLRSLPYVKAWAARYEKDGLVVVGVHSPEFAFERDPENVRKA
ncbi:MAG: cytochrome c biogenesis protein/redoxin, partial [Gemmatimonadales bacterium]